MEDARLYRDEKHHHNTPEEHEKMSFLSSVRARLHRGSVSMLRQFRDD